MRAVVNLLELIAMLLAYLAGGWPLLAVVFFALWVFNIATGATL